MCRRCRQNPDTDNPARGRNELEHRPAGLTALERPARDHEAPTGGSHRRVTNREGQMRHHPRAGTRPPGHDRVQPPRPRETAHHIRRPPNRGSRLIRTRRRQTPHHPRRTRPRVNPHDLRTLTRRITTTKQIDSPTETHSRGVMHRERKPPHHPSASLTNQRDHIRRYIRRRQPPSQHNPSTSCFGGGRILHSGRKSTRPSRRKPHAPGAGRMRMGRGRTARACSGRNRLRGSIRAFEAQQVQRQPHAAGHHDSARQQSPAPRRVPFRGPPPATPRGWHKVDCHSRVREPRLSPRRGTLPTVC